MKFPCRLLFLFSCVFTYYSSQSQGVTTASMTGVVITTEGKPLSGASVLALHIPTGTQYGTTTNNNGRYTIPNMRVGGPYTVIISTVGFQTQQVDSVQLALGSAATFNFDLSQSSGSLSEVTVTSKRSSLFNSHRTGAGTNVQRQVINSLPTISRSIADFTRLTPQATGLTFGGQDNRLNNITIDGSYLNSSFGLSSGLPGSRTGTTAISLDAIEQIQVNMAPYDVRQSGFTGAGINAVTRSGTNEFSGSAFYNFQNQNFVGDKAKGATVTINEFKSQQAGFRVGGPIIKNKLFFFLNGEVERRTDPATLYRANKGNEPVGGNVTRVLASDLDQLSAFLRTSFGYETGPYQDYNNERKSDKFLAKLDYNISQKHRASLRYNMLNSRQDVMLSNGGMYGNRRDNLNSLTYRNNNYIQLEKINSVIGELNSTFSSRFSNKLIAGYTYQDEGRDRRGDLFPLIDIANAGITYISAGFDAFTHLNEVSYSTFQFQDNFTYYAGKHTLTAGLNLEKLKFNNTFVQNGVGVYTYNSLDDFYAAANAYLANPDATTSPVTIRRFQQQYSALPGNAKPTSTTKLTYTGLYVQDEWAARPNLTITAGLRADVPFFDETGLYNAAVAAMTFKDENGKELKVNTTSMPPARPLWSPRLGFNWDVMGDKTLQVRGGSGVFTGRPPFVWIGNQIGQNGVLLGTTDVENTTAIPFNPSITAHYPAVPTLPSTYQVNITAGNYKFPQVWRSNVGIDKTLFAGIVGTVEVIYNKNVNAVRYVNINQKDPVGTFAGPDNRLRYPGTAVTNRLNPAIIANYYMTTTNEGYSYSITTQLERPFSNGLFARVAYNYGRAKDLMSAGSTAGGTYNGIFSVSGGNYPEISFSDNDLRHRVIGSVSYRKEYKNFGATQVGLFYEARNQGRFSYIYNGDMNGDGINGNDLIYVPKSASEIIFLPIVFGGTELFSPAQQAAAFDAYIEQDAYLSSIRGSYTERNGTLMPWIFRADASLVQEFFIRTGRKRNALQFRVDVFNVGNLLNNDWGVGYRFINRSPLNAAGTNAQGVPQYRMATLGTGVNQTLLSSTYQRSTVQSDVWSAQFGIRYIFN
jgi:outer membrane receptor for ferrienterochelin and colicin